MAKQKEIIDNPQFKGVEFDPLFAIQQMTVLENVESKHILKELK